MSEAADARPSTAIWPDETFVSAAGSQATALTAPVTLAQADTARAGTGPRITRRALQSLPWPLLAIATVQAALSLRLVPSNTAFQDEALYLWAGHMEWSHWLHGAPIPAFQTYFSGAPVVYPPLGALADTYGGLAAARLLSLCLMLGATCLLYYVTLRVFDSRSAFFGAALFAGLGATQFLGALATYDAMAVALLALATWLGIRTADTRPGPGIALLVLAGSALALADATKYAASLFDPVVIAAVAAYVWRRRGRRAGLVAAACPLLTLTAMLGAAILAGGHAYWLGITVTTLARSGSDTPAPGVLYASALWIGSVAILAVIGTVAACVRHRRWTIASMAGVLCGALFLAPVQQARIHTITSLFKHVGFGAWFGCIIAGFALASFLEAVPAGKVAGAMRASLAATVLSAIVGIAFATSHFHSWPNSTAFSARLGIVAAAYPGPILEANNIPQYYVPRLRWRTVISTSFFSYQDPATGRLISGQRAYADAIMHGYFSIIALDFSSTGQEDDTINRAIAAAGNYRLAAVVRFVAYGSRGSYQVWVIHPTPAGRRTAPGHDRQRIQ